MNILPESYKKKRKFVIFRKNEPKSPPSPSFQLTLILNRFANLKLNVLDLYI